MITDNDLQDFLDSKVVFVVTKDDYETFASEITERCDIRWASGHRPADFTPEPFRLRTMDSLGFRGGRRLTYCYPVDYRDHNERRVHYSEAKLNISPDELFQ